MTRQEKNAAMVTFIRENRNLIWNDFTDLLENDYKPIDSFFFPSLKINMIEAGIDFKDSDLTSLLDHKPSYDSYHPLTRAVSGHRDSLDANRDYIKEYAMALPSTLGFESDGEFNPEAHVIYLKKWYVNMIASFMRLPNSANPLVPLILSREQGTGKTEWCRRIFPESLKTYMAESNVDSSDLSVLATQKGVILFDELGGMGQSDMAKLKALLSQESITRRKLYTNITESHRRVASFIGTANEIKVLRDLTGNRRFLPINITGKVNWEVVNSVPKELMILQALALLEQDYDYRLTTDELAYINARVESNQLGSNEQDMVNELIVLPAPDNNDNMVRNTSEILSSFADGTRGIKLSRYHLNSVLEAAGFENKNWSINKGTKRGWKMNRSSVVGNQF